MKSAARSRDLWFGIGAMAIALLLVLGFVVSGASKDQPCRPGRGYAKQAPCSIRAPRGRDPKRWLILVLDRMITITTRLAA